METQYIIKFSTSTNETKIDGYVELKKNNNNIPIITIRTHKDLSDKSNETLLYKFMTNNFATFTFDDNLRQCALCYKDFGSDILHTPMIYFDSSSSSAYSDFKKNFEEYYNTKFETEYYPNGREMYIGEVLYKKDSENNVTSRIPNGKGTMYYDLPNRMVKYTGDFESGLYDGSGIFYSMDGKISLVSKNISSGIPTQKGKLNINYSSFQKVNTKTKDVLEIKFNDIWEKYQMTEKDMKRMFVISDNFVNKLASDILLDCNTNIDDLIFGDKTDNEKYIEIRNMLKLQENKIDELDRKYKKLITTQTNIIIRFEIVSLALILFTTIVVGILT